MHFPAETKAARICYPLAPIRLLTLFTPAGWKMPFATAGLTPQDLDLPAGSLTYCKADAEPNCTTIPWVGVRFLTRDEIAENCPCIPSRLPRIQQVTKRSAKAGERIDVTTKRFGPDAVIQTQLNFRDVVSYCRCE